MDIKLFVCCHEPAEVPSHPLLIPLQVGAALAKEHFPGFLHDDKGDHISDRNRSYCELTGQYWAWKNVEADYYGLFHYRRYLYPDQTAKLPYRIEGGPALPTLERLGYPGFAGLISQYDMVLPKREDMRIPVWKHYASAPFHHGEDLALVKDIVRKRSPEMSAAMDSYLSNTACYFGNIFIMKRPVFEDYCAWLFPILEEFDQTADTAGRSGQGRRADGYLAERLLGIYAAHHRELKSLEVPRVHFIEDPAERCKKRVVNFFLPPGSVRRSWIKGLKR